jgi:hypothetical protein
MQPLGPFFASLFAPLVALAPQLVFIAHALDRPDAPFNGESSDALERMVSVLPVALPVVWVVLAVLAYAIGTLFLRLGIRTMSKFLVASAILCALFSILISIERASLGTGEQITFTLVSFAMIAVSVMPGAACWLILAKGRGDA